MKYKNNDIMRLLRMKKNSIKLHQSLKVLINKFLFITLWFSFHLAEYFKFGVNTYRRLSPKAISRNFHRS